MFSFFTMPAYRFGKMVNISRTVTKEIIMDKLFTDVHYLHKEGRHILSLVSLKLDDLQGNHHKWCYYWLWHGILSPKRREKKKTQSICIPSTPTIYHVKCSSTTTPFKFLLMICTQPQPKDTLSVSGYRSQWTANWQAEQTPHTLTYARRARKGS